MSQHKALSWKIHLRSSPEQVFHLLSTDEGRKAFWAEDSFQQGDAIAFTFPNGQKCIARLITASPPSLYRLHYFGTQVSFYLQADGKGGTDLELSNTEISPDQYYDQATGWISVLLALKAAADFGIDLRNHEAGRSWSQGYVDN